MEESEPCSTLNAKLKTPLPLAPTQAETQWRPLGTGGHTLWLVPRCQAGTGGVCWGRQQKHRGPSESRTGEPQPGSHTPRVPRVGDREEVNRFNQVLNTPHSMPG